MTDLIIVGAGESSRFGENKLLYLLEEQTVIEKNINQFLSHSEIEQIIIVTNQEVQDFLEKKYPNKFIFVKGGKTRSESVKNGLSFTKAQNVLVHDGARPFVSKELINTIITNLQDNDCVVPIEAITSCLKTKKNNKIITVNRSEFFTSQTPQGFRSNVLKKAYENFNPNWFDDCQAVEEMGYEIKTIPGEKTNIKITFFDDLVLKK